MEKVKNILRFTAIMKWFKGTEHTPLKDLLFVDEKYLKKLHKGFYDYLEFFKISVIFQF
jgi:hypothetical protein